MNNIKYFLYARKSQESEDRQVQSLEDQINVMKKKAEYLGITIVNTFIESKSAKAPGREEFNKMIAQIYEGKAKGIISWKLDRLSRNPIDTGTIQYMLQTGGIDRIITNDRDYNPVDAGLLMSVETGMANQFILDLKKNVKRGMDSKYYKGIRPTMAPLGYLNDKREKTIEIDKDRFQIIRGMWDLLLTGNYTPNQINDKITKEFGFRTRIFKNSGGKELSNSGIYRIFHNIYYSGYYYRNGELIKGTHSPMITLEEFDRAQELLGRKGNPRAQVYEFPFTGMIRCGECGCSITAENKKKIIKSTNEVRKYTYYHCTKKKKDSKCNQKNIRDGELESQIIDILNSIEIIPDFKEWALDIVSKDYKNDIDLKLKQIESINKTILSEENSLTRLTDLLIKELVSESEFIIRKKEVQSTIAKLKDTRDKIDLKKDEVQELTVKTFDFVSKAKEKFENGNLETKKLILSTLGENLILKNGEVSVELNPWFRVIKNNISRIKGDLNRLEPKEKGIRISKTDTLKLDSCIWLGW